MILETSKPFLTQELLEQRREQRCFLAGLPDWLLQDHSPTGLDVGPVLPPNPARVEASYRRYADIVRERYSATLTQFASNRVSTEDLEAVSYLRAWESSLFDLGIITASNKFFPAMFDYFKERIDGKINGTVDPEIGAFLSEFLNEVIPALEMADALADDGYRDSRIKRH